VVGLGGNLNREALVRARGWLMDLLARSAVSGLYRTSPLLDADQDDFWNAAVAGDWSGTPETLLERLLMFESGEGRQRDPARPKGPRILDLDLLVFGEVLRSSARLTLPHSGLHERRFALQPLTEIEPLARDPRTGRLWTEILATLPSQGVDLVARTW
jgi:2-amino-4-hydroxy-6-hydroxymethyldihydropteridine diphosphokinase